MPFIILVNDHTHGPEVLNTDQISSVVPVPEGDSWSLDSVVITMSTRAGSPVRYALPHAIRKANPTDILSTMESFTDWIEDEAIDQRETAERRREQKVEREHRARLKQDRETRRRDREQREGEQA